MISITAILKAKHENVEQVHNMLRHLVTETRKEEACLKYDLHATKNVFIIWEEWTNQEGIDKHNDKSYLHQFIAKTETFMAAPIAVYKTEQIL